MKSRMVTSSVFVISSVIAHSVAYGDLQNTTWTYQGQLKQGGAPLDGVADFEFSLWNAIEDGDQIGSTVMVNGIHVESGLFSVQLDFGVEVFDGAARWLQIATRAPAGGGELVTLSPRQPLTGVPYALQMRGLHCDASGNVGVGTTTPAEKLTVAGVVESTNGAFKFPDGTVQTTAAASVPIGAVIDWWRPNDTFPIPDGYQICDGSQVDDPQSPYHGATLPDLRDKFVRGAQSATEIGQSGGAANHNHAINHNHPSATTDSSGDHNHPWSLYGSGTWATWLEDGSQHQIIVWGDGMNATGSGYFPLAYEGGGIWSLYTDGGGTHTHTVDLPTLATTSGDADQLPPYVGLLKIMRVK